MMYRVDTRTRAGDRYDRKGRVDGNFYLLIPDLSLSCGAKGSTAREIEADEGKSTSDQLLGRLAKMRPEPRNKKPGR